MRKTRVWLAFPLLAGLMAGGCDTDSATAAGEPTLLRFEGVVHSDAGGTLGGPLLVRVFRPNGQGGWGETEAQAGTGYSMEVMLRDGCEPGSSLEAVATIQVPDHRFLDEDLGGGRPVLCTSETQPLDHTLSRVIFRTPVPVAGGLEATQVSGYRMRCARGSEGVSCWGFGVWTPTLVPGSAGFQEVDAGLSHACALDGEGTAWCWGSSSSGALGVPGVQASEVPARVETELRFTQVVATVESTCGLADEGALYCWGTDGGETPQRMADGIRFRAISGLAWHMCGIDDGGEVLCWGANGWGEMGVPAGLRVEEPQRIEGLSNVASVSAGYGFNCALTEEGELYCWGWNCDGQLGRTTTGAANPMPGLASGVPAMEQVALGLGYTCVLTASGEVWCWGLNSWGQLGAETPGVRSLEPVRVSGDVRFRSIAGGHRGSCGIAIDGRVHCWGDRTDLGAGAPVAESVEAGRWEGSHPVAEGHLPGGLTGGSSCQF